jgi:methylmalonyl-CoA mutase
VNKYRLKEQQQVEVLRIDNTKVRESQIKRINDTKKSRNPEKVKAALERLTQAANATTNDKEHNLLKLAVEAARERATLGEISAALESVWGRHVASTQVVQGAYSGSYGAKSAGSSDQSSVAKEYQEVLSEVKAFASKEGRRPRILVAKMGQDGHDRGAKVIASGFSDLGYDVDIGPLFSTPEEVAQQAIDADVHLVGVSSQAAGHKTLIPALIKVLGEKGGSHIKVIAGGVIPPQDYDALYTSGVIGIFGPGTRITEAARMVLKSISSSK